MSINKEWHQKHKMPKNANLGKKIEWDREHNRHCSCHPGFPEALLKEMKKRGLDKTRNLLKMH